MGSSLVVIIRTLRLLFDDDLFEDPLLRFDNMELKFDLVLRSLPLEEFLLIFVIERGFLFVGASLILNDSEYMASVFVYN